MNKHMTDVADKDASFTNQYRRQAMQHQIEHHYHQRSKVAFRIAIIATVVFLAAMVISIVGLFVPIGFLDKYSGVTLVPFTGDHIEDVASSGSGVEESHSVGVAGTSADSDTVTIDLLAIGDILVHEPVWESGMQEDGTYNYDHIFAQIADDVKAADVALVNQETILGGTELGIQGYPSFNSPQEFGDAEVAAGFDVILKANNHVLDQGNIGVENELTFWRDNYPQIAVLGMADSQETYDAIYVYEKDDFRVAILNYTYGTNGISLPADNPYATHLLDDGTIDDAIAQAKAESDIVVMCVHWGTEYMTSPDESQLWWAQYFADEGVDVVIGGHSHCLEPVDVLEGESGNQTLVYYSLGNFTACQAQGTLTAVGGIAKVTLVKDSDGAYVSRYELDPTVIQADDGDAYTTYKLSDYTDKLASSNWTGTTPESAEELCKEIFGDAYDTKKCILVGTL